VILDRSRDEAVNVSNSDYSEAQNSLLMAIIFGTVVCFFKKN
jgi:hypothetical protein